MQAIVISIAWKKPICTQAMRSMLKSRKVLSKGRWARPHHSKKMFGELRLEAYCFINLSSFIQ